MSSCMTPDQCTHRPLIETYFNHQSSMVQTLKKKGGGGGAIFSASIFRINIFILHFVKRISKYTAEQ